MTSIFIDGTIYDVPILSSYTGGSVIKYYAGGDATAAFMNFIIGLGMQKVF